MNEGKTSRMLLVADLGHTDYKWCWDLQHRIVNARRLGRGADVLLLTQHDHVYTIGRTGDANHLLATDAELKARGIDVYFNDRGGDITYHGPGQLVGYPLLDLSNYSCDLHRYLRDIEEAVIRALQVFGIRARRWSGYTGVWVGTDKICAIGIRSSRWLTMHGFALNVHTDLTYFERIIPCGIFERGVTSMQEVLGRALGVGEVAPVITRTFAQVFGAEICWLTLPDLLALIGPEELTVAANAGPASLLAEISEKGDS